MLADLYTYELATLSKFECLHPCVLFVSTLEINPHFLTFSKGEAEVWMLVTHQIGAVVKYVRQLFPTLISLLIFNHASDIDNRRSCRTHARQSESSAKSSVEPWGLPIKEDIGTDERACGAEVHCCSEGNSALVPFTSIKGDPDKCNWHCEIAAACHEE